MGLPGHVDGIHVSTYHAFKHKYDILYPYTRIP